MTYVYINVISVWLMYIYIYSGKREFHVLSQPRRQAITFGLFNFGDNYSEQAGNKTYDFSVIDRKQGCLQITKTGIRASRQIPSFTRVGHRTEKTTDNEPGRSTLPVESTRSWPSSAQVSVSRWPSICIDQALQPPPNGSLRHSGQLLVQQWIPGKLFEILQVEYDRLDVPMVHGARLTLHEISTCTHDMCLRMPKKKKYIYPSRN